MEQVTKTCSKCGEEKSLELFWKRKTSSNGHAGQCKNCMKIVYREYNKNPKYKEGKRKYSLEHRDRVLINKRKYNKSEKKKECDKSYKEKYPDRILESQRKFQESPRFKEYHELYKPRRNLLIQKRLLNDTAFNIKFSE